MCKATQAACTTPDFTFDVTQVLPTLLKESQRRYILGLGLAYTVEGAGSGTPEVHHTDGLGSARAVTGGSGSIQYSYVSDDFGVSKLVRGGGAGLRMQYTGEVRDSESGFIDLRSRVYDPNVGQFLQADVFGGYFSLPQSLHRFSYALNRPTVLVDPAGTSPITTTTPPCLPTLISSKVCPGLAPPVTVGGAKAEKEKQTYADKGCGNYLQKGVVLQDNPHIGALAHGPEPDLSNQCHVNLALTQKGVNVKQSPVNLHIIYENELGFIALGFGAPAFPANQFGHDPLSAAGKAIAAFVLKAKASVKNLDTEPASGILFLAAVSQMLSNLKEHELSNK